MTELQTVLKNLGDYIELKGAKKKGGLIAAVRFLYLETKVSDIEIFVPINKAISSNTEFTHLPCFNLTNCVSARYTGAAYLIPNAYAEFYQKAHGLGLKIQQPFYNVFAEDFVKEADSAWGLNLIEMDIYAVVEGF